MKYAESDIENQLSRQNSRILWSRCYAMILIIIFTVIIVSYYARTKN
jgi:hypothetical protein